MNFIQRTHRVKIIIYIKLLYKSCGSICKKAPVLSTSVHKAITRVLLMINILKMPKGMNHNFFSQGPGYEKIKAPKP